MQHYLVAMFIFSYDLLCWSLRKNTLVVNARRSDLIDINSNPVPSLEALWDLLLWDLVLITKIIVSS